MDFHDGASCHMASSNSMTAGGEIFSVEGIGDILLCFRFDSGAFGVQLVNVTIVPHRSHHLLSMQHLTASHFTYFGANDDVKLRYNVRPYTKS